MTAKPKKSGAKTALKAVFWTVLALLIIAIVLLSPKRGELKQSFPERDLGEWAAASPRAWMAQLRGDIMLSDIAMAGSHDSGTEYVLLPLIARCQDSSISEQLSMGVRALDIRLNTKQVQDGSYELFISHGFVPCKTGSWILSEDLSFAQVLEECCAFLDANPTETVLLLLKHENGEGTAQELQAAIDRCAADYAEYWYDEAREPTLDEARGKIVLARRYGEGEENLSGLDFCWQDQGGSQVQPESWAEHEVSDELSLWVQDRFEYEREDKWNAVSDCLEDTRKGFSLNYLSTKGSSFVGVPRRYAKSLNARFMELELEKESDLGVVMLDFVTPELAARIYATNEMG